MRVALARKTQIPRAAVARKKSYPAPVGGWNARDPLAHMKPTEAVALDNWFPKTSYVEGRGGYASHATGMTGAGKTLAVHNAMAGTGKMFCATASGVYDVSSAGAVGASVAARTNGKHQWTMFGDGTNNWLIMCNGVDKPLYYDGTTWTAVDAASTPALAGLTTTDIIAVCVHKGRLFFIQKNSLSVWYLAAGAAGGALTRFDLSGEAKRGGYLVAMATWTIDAGDGVDDRAVFITSKGEVIVYVGTNPTAAATWAKVGTYFVGEPLGRRCFVQYGGDVVLVTQNGALPLSSALQSAVIDNKMALSFKIEQAFTAAAVSYGSVFGWCAYVYPAQSALVVNVPLVEDGEHHQYVMNTVTKAWCRFKGWDAEDFAIFNGELYFASGTNVRKAWTGTSDLGANIEYYGKTAFSYFDSPGTLKHFKLFRPLLAVTGSMGYLVDIDVDFEDSEIGGVASFTSVSGATWDVSLWDVGMWAAGPEVANEWTAPAAWEGRCAAGKIKVASNALSLQWAACDWVWEQGTGL